MSEHPEPDPHMLARTVPSVPARSTRRHLRCRRSRPLVTTPAEEQQVKPLTAALYALSCLIPTWLNLRKGGKR